MISLTGKIILSALLLSTATPVLAAPVCKSLFRTDAATPISVEATIEDLAAYRIKLDAARADGRTSAAMLAMESDYRKKENSLVEHIKQTQLMTTSELLEKLKSAIHKIQNEQAQKNAENKKNRKLEKENKKEQQRVIHESVPTGTTAIFNPVKPGTFEMMQANFFGIADIPVTVTLTKPYNLMATPITQLIWRAVAELANAKLGKNMNPDPSENKGDLHPVESISYNSIQLWIESLNELSARGTPELSAVINDFQPGDKFRLPTEAEWEFVIREGGINKSNDYFGGDRKILEQYAYIEENLTQDVGLKLPLTVGGRNFYDMIAHVFEFTSDTLVDSYDPIRGGTDPHFFQAGNMHIVRGSNSWVKATTFHPHKDKGNGSFRTGFRLVLENRNSGDTP